MALERLQWPDIPLLQSRSASVLVNNAMMTAISNYVAQNYGAGLWDRIRKGTAACLLQTSIANALMCVMIIFGRIWSCPCL